MLPANLPGLASAEEDAQLRNFWARLKAEEQEGALRSTQFVADAAEHPGLRDFWLQLKAEEAESVFRLKQLVVTKWERADRQESHAPQQAPF